MAENPALAVPKPRQLPTTRRAVPNSRIEEINQAAATSGNDPELDSLLLRIHEETACRRGGALALRPPDLDQDQCLILLRENGGTSRWQPVSPTLMAHLLQHAEQRRAPRDGQLLRYRNGKPITYRRYDHLWVRIGAWTQLLLLDGELAAAEPKKLRYRLLHVAARITRSARRTRLRIAQSWPWAADLVAAFTRLATLPRPATAPGHHHTPRPEPTTSRSTSALNHHDRQLAKDRG